MKIVFKIISQLRLLAALAVLAAAVPARADQVYFTPRDLLGDFFRSSQNVTYKKIQLDDGARQRLQHRLGYTPSKQSYTFYVATSGGHVDGYALIDEEKGEHQPITFAVKLSPAGKIERQEIVIYREARGDEVRDEKFRHQFVGKGPSDAITTEQDIMAVSGATISSRAMAVGVKRAVVLFDELVKPTVVVTASR
ncbi:MAG: putative signal peptide protein [Myxococcales bacterium]|nr:putative signal peptide protein [Myxococcales bacterium]